MVLQNRAAYQVLLTWQSWAAERSLLRQQLLSALGHWQHQALAAAFMRFRCLHPSPSSGTCTGASARTCLKMMYCMHLLHHPCWLTLSSWLK